MAFRFGNLLSGQVLLKVRNKVALRVRNLNYAAVLREMLVHRPIDNLEKCLACLEVLVLLLGGLDLHFSEQLGK